MLLIVNSFLSEASTLPIIWAGTLNDSEIEMIRTYLHGRSRENVLIEELKPGDTVVVLRGALKDQQAFVEHLSPSRVRLVLPVLGYKITTKLSDVAPVRAASWGWKSFRNLSERSLLFVWSSVFFIF